MPIGARRLAAFTAFGIATDAAIGFVLDQVPVGLTVGAACGTLFGYLATQ